MQIEVITREEFEPVLKALDTALHRIAELENAQKQWLNTEDACTLIGVSRTTLENLRRAGKVECNYEGRSPRYSRTSLQEYRKMKIAS